MNGRLHPVFARFMEHDEEYWVIILCLFRNIMKNIE